MNEGLSMARAIGSSRMPYQLGKCWALMVRVLGRVAVLGLVLVSVETYANSIDYPSDRILPGEKYIGYFEYNGLITESTVAINRPLLFPNSDVLKKYFVFNVGDPVFIAIHAIHLFENSDGEREDLPGLYHLDGYIKTPNFVLSVDGNTSYGNRAYSRDFSQQTLSAYFCCALSGGHEEAQAFWADENVTLEYFPTGTPDEILFRAQAVGTTQFFPVPEPSSILLLIVGLLGMVMFRLKAGLMVKRQLVKQF